MKKKLLVLFLTLVCLVSALVLVSCGGSDNRPSYTVTFDPAGAAFDGELTIQVKEGDKIPTPADPVIEGKIFIGWHSGKESSTKWNFDEDVVTGDVNLKAWFTGGSSCAHDVTIPLPEKSTAATCETGGKEYVKCTKCGLTTFTNIPKLGHDIKTEVVPETCATDGYTRVYCLREGCDEDRTHSVIPATGNHQYAPGFVTIIEPTMYVGGKEAKVCTVCGYQLLFPIASLAELDELLWDIEIGNYTYTGGQYIDASFVDIAKTAGIDATSFYTVCAAKNAIDGGAGSFWCADTLADGAKFTGDIVSLSFSQKFDIGMVKLTVPHYYAWNLGEGCYVSYDLEAYIDGEWQVVGFLSDKNAVPSGNGGAIIYEFDAPINTDKLRLVVTNSSRHTPAMIYEIEVMAAVENTERVSADLINASTITSSGKYNSWASGTETLMDGSHDTAWYTNRTGDIFATITFPEDKFVTAVQFSVASISSSREFSIYYLDKDGTTWIKACTYSLKGTNSSGDSDGDGVSDGKSVVINGKTRIIFTCEIANFTSGVKFTIDKNGPDYESYIYEFVPYTAIEQAVISSPEKPNGIETFSGCAHGSFKTLKVVEPTCTEAGYTIMECYGCGLKCNTDAIDAYGHAWGEYEITLAAEGDGAGTKTSSCKYCDATRATEYYNNYEDSTITTYFHNAPAAWAQTYDDGNYLSTYEWLVPKLQKYGWRVTAVISVCYVDMYVNEWNDYLSTGVFDIGSHSYTHGGYYSGQISENSLLSDVVNAHYWFMNKFAGQRILGFATPNGQTSTGTSEFVTGIMAAARNGGNSKYFYNVIDELVSNGRGQSALVESITIDEETGEVVFTQATDKEGNLKWVTTRRAWGNLNSYISKADQTEGAYVLVSSDNKTPARFKLVTQAPVIDEETGEQAVDENGNLVWETLKTPEYQVAESGGYIYENSSYKWTDKGETHYLIMSPNGSYHYVAIEELATNYVYDSVSNRLQPRERCDGTYRYYESKDANGKLLDSYYEWVEVGSYNYENGNFIFVEDNSGTYKLNHVTLGSYEKGINEILSVGGMTVECLHELGGGSIWSSYCSTNSKFTYLDQTGIWVCSYTQLVQYMKEQVNATVTTTARTETSVKLTVTDTLDDIMYNAALTIKVDIDDSWTSVSATQNGEAVNVYIENGFAYVDAVPDRGEVVISVN